MKKIAFIEILLATFFWGSMVIASKIACEYGATPLSVATYRHLFVSILCAIFILRRKSRKLHLPVIIIGALSFPIMSFSYFLTAELVSASFAAFMINTAPIYVLLFSFLMFREKLTKSKIVCLIMALIGMYLLTLPVFNFSIIGVISGIISGISYASITITAKYYLEKKVELEQIIFEMLLFSPVLLVIVSSISDDILKISPHSLILILYICFCSTFLAYIFYFKALKKLEASVVSIIAIMEPVWATILGLIILQEAMTLIMYIGALLIILSSIILAKVQK